jgi:hypothetical protein
MQNGRINKRGHHDCRKDYAAGSRRRWKGARQSAGDRWHGGPGQRRRHLNISRLVQRWGTEGSPRLTLPDRPSSLQEVVLDLHRGFSLVSSPPGGHTRCRLGWGVRRAPGSLRLPASRRPSQEHLGAGPPGGTARCRRRRTAGIRSIWGRPDSSMRGEPPANLPMFIEAN